MTLSPEEAEDLGKRLTGLAAASRLGGKLSPDEESALLAGCLIRKSLDGRCRVNLITTNRQQDLKIYNEAGVMIGTTLNNIPPAFTLTYVPTHDDDA